MSVINTQPLAGSSGQATGYNIERSLRFRKAAPAYLTRTPASSGSTTTWTVSFWYKYSETGVLFEAGDYGNRDDGVVLGSSGNLEFYIYNSTYTGRLKTTQLLRDPSAWYHITCVWDTTNATSTERMRMYINGVRVTAFDIATYPSLNATSGLNTSSFAHGIGAWANASYPAGGYMADFRFIDGQALNASSFGETDTTTGVWKPKRFSGTYGTNGFYLPFTDVATTSGSNAGLGKDFSGNGNYWTTNNISVTSGATYDSMTDVPTLTSATAANYCVMNPVDKHPSVTTSNANLTTGYTGTGWLSIRGSIGMTTGKWYWEHTQISGGQIITGIGTIAAPWANYPGSSTASYGYLNSTGNKYTNGVATAYGSTWTNNDVIGFAFDADAGTLTYYKNGTSQGVAFTSIPAGTYFPMVGFDGSSVAFNFGQQGFKYTPPTGFKALNTYNLPDSTIVAGNKYMDATTYTGTGSTRTVTNVGGFQPDFVWIKPRSATDHNILYDSVRGVRKQLYSNLTNAEETETQGLSAFASSGFTVNGPHTVRGQTNDSGVTYVGWQWQAGQGTTSSNTSGSITSTVSVNASAGFSIVTYTGNGAAATVGHGLGVAPSLIIIKNRSIVENWLIYHKSIPNTAFLDFTTAAATTASGAFNNTSPTSTTFAVGTSSRGNGSTNNHVAYCWSEIAGFSKFGSYTGNSNADGPFTYLGFRPKYILIKCTSSGYDWVVYDTATATYNVISNNLWPNLSNAEYSNTASTGLLIDTLSNGFKIRGTNTEVNNNGLTYIYAAFAESPFKNALAR